jgi:hypothetical protein
VDKPVEKESVPPGNYLFYWDSFILIGFQPALWRRSFFVKKPTSPPEGGDCRMVPSPNQRQLAFSILKTRKPVGTQVRINAITTSIGSIMSVLLMSKARAMTVVRYSP